MGINGQDIRNVEELKKYMPLLEQPADAEIRILRNQSERFLKSNTIK